MSDETTELLRELLSENGIEWKSGRTNAKITSWNNGKWRVSAQELADGTLLMRAHSTNHLTPEQAIAATLGNTCKVSKPNCSDFFNLCSECGEQWSQVSAPKFCPNCGAKAVER